MGDRSSVLSGSSEGVPPVRISRNAPPPEQWTLVRELNMEKREPCEIWRSGVNHQLYKMKEQFSRCGKVIKGLEKDIAEDRQAILSSRWSPKDEESS